MEEFSIKIGDHVSRILLGESIANLKSYLPDNKKVVIITDCNIIKHYSKYLQGFDVIELTPGEENKTLATIDYIMGRLVELEADRSTFIVGIGGGIVTDTTGFAASVYMRGIRFGFVSTTLLAQVDASVGGKNGVNYKGFKNMVGVFNQPEFVICDFEMFKTLPQQEYLGGYAEVIKHGAIKDLALFEYLEKNYTKALEYSPEAIHRSVADSVKIKTNVVMQDEREKGERRKLNFGHTFAHAIEKLTSFSHGQAVAIGMYLAAQVSVKKGFLAQSQADRLKQLIVNLQLPISAGIESKQLFQAMKKDKKREGENVHLILLQAIGDAVVVNVSYNELEELVNDLR